MSFSHHFHRYPSSPVYYNPSPYGQQMAPMAPSPYYNAQGVAVQPTYYEPMSAPAMLPPQYNDHAVAPSPYPLMDQHPHRFGGIKSHVKARLSQKYHYPETQYQYTGYDAAGYPSQGLDSYGSGSVQQKQQLQHQQQQHQQLQQHQQHQQPQRQVEQYPPNSPYDMHSPPPAPIELSHEYMSGLSSMSPSLVPTGTPPTIRTPQPPQPSTSEYSVARNTTPLPTPTEVTERHRSLPSQNTTQSSTPSMQRSASAPSTTNRRPRSIGTSRDSNSSSSSTSSHVNRTVVAAIPTNMAHEERRQLAMNLLNEIDAYERMQNRVFLFRLLPPLRFRVTVVRNIDGVPQQTETMMTMTELRNQLQHALEHDTQMVDQLGMTYENLVGLTRVQLGVKDLTVFPTFTYTHDCHIPADKSTCSVCLSDFQEGDMIKTVPCMHLFHTECIDEWLKMSKVCPVCKTCVEDENAIIDDDDDDCHKRKNL